jgi:glycosyltransferase involved in cell wall biosynthesis
VGRTDVLEQLGLPTDLPMVAQLGMISRLKGQYVTAEAFVRLADRGGAPMFSLVFFGKGSPEEEQIVFDLIAQTPAEWRAVVRFDVMEAGDLSGLAAADIVVHPSTLHDSYPNAIREAMTLRRPVIASALGGIVDMIANGETGLLIPPGDSAALASALELLSARPELRRRLGSNAGVFAEQRFDVHELKRAFIELLTQVSQSHDGVKSSRDKVT